jgi:hypothetical protein
MFAENRLKSPKIVSIALNYGFALITTCLICPKYLLTYINIYSKLVTEPRKVYT